MHLFIGTRGITYEVQHMIDVLHSNFCKYKIGDQEIAVQLACRPIQLWELVFPKEALSSVVKGLVPDWNGESKRATMQFALLRKALQARKIPKLDLKDVTPINHFAPNVAVYPFGIKDDGNWPEDSEMKGAEKL